MAGHSYDPYLLQVYYKIFCAARRLVVEEQRSQVHTPYQPREDFDDESGPSVLSRSVIPNVELEDSPVEQHSEKASMTVSRSIDSSWYIASCSSPICGHDRWLSHLPDQFSFEPSMTNLIYRFVVRLRTNHSICNGIGNYIRLKKRWYLTC